MASLSSATETGPGTDPVRLPSAGRAALLLDVLMGFSVLAGLLWTLRMLEDLRIPVALTGGFLLIVLLMSALWLLIRLQERQAPRLVAAFAVLGALGPFVADGFGAWPLLLMALLIVTPCFGPGSGVVLVSVELSAQLIILLCLDRPASETVFQLAGSVYVYGFGLVLAWLLAEYVRHQQRIVDLLAEVRHGQAAEVELALSDERTRAARDLHDGLGHRLTLIGMALAFAVRARERDPVRSWEQVERARIEAGEALTTMRRWVRALSPVRVEDGPLDVTLNAVAESFRGPGLVVRVRGRTGADDDGTDLSQGVALFLHRFVQEALTNVLRHARAARVEVDYRVVGHAVELSVRDDGSPGSPERPPPTPGFGLRTLSERAADLGGGVTTAWSGSGLILSAQLPRAPLPPGPGRLPS